MNEERELWRVIGSHFRCDLVVHKGVVTYSAPVMQWSQGRLLSEILSWCSTKGHKIEKMYEYKNDKSDGRSEPRKYKKCSTYLSNLD